MHRDFANMQEKQKLIEKAGKGCQHISHSLKTTNG